MRVGSSSSDRKIYLGGNYYPSNMMKSGIEDNREVNQALLGEVKIQDDVKMYRRLRGYDYFRILIRQMRQI